MSYYLKYLKYKNKYLELKKQIGGAQLTQDVVKNLFEKNIKYPSSNSNFVQYCFIGTPQSNKYGYNNGFFIYELKEKAKLNSSFIKIGPAKYAIKGVDKFTQSDVSDYDEKTIPNKNIPKEYNFQSTGIKIKTLGDKFEGDCDSDSDSNEDCIYEEKEEILIAQDTPYDWFQFNNSKGDVIFQGWIYNVDNKPKYYIKRNPFE